MRQVKLKERKLQNIRRYVCYYNDKEVPTLQIRLKSCSRDRTVEHNLVFNKGRGELIDFSALSVLP